MTNLIGSTSSAPGTMSSFRPLAVANCFAAATLRQPSRRKETIPAAGSGKACANGLKLSASALLLAPVNTSDEGDGDGQHNSSKLRKAFQPDVHPGWYRIGHVNMLACKQPNSIPRASESRGLTARSPLGSTASPPRETGKQSFSRIGYFAQYLISRAAILLHVEKLVNACDNWS